MKLKFLLIIILISVVKSARILGFFNFPSISHQYVFRAIVKELSLRGHEVTFVTPNPLNDPTLTNLTEIDISIGYEVFKKMDISNFNRQHFSLFKIHLIESDLMKTIIEIQMNVTDVKKLFKKPENSFDLLLVEGFLPFLNGIQHKFKVPLIAISSFAVQNDYHEIAGNPVHPVLYPDMLTNLLSPVENFWDKLDGLYVNLFGQFMSKYYLLPAYDELARKYFGQDMPYLKDLLKNTSLMIGYNNPIFSDRRPLAPNVIDVWNLHLSRNDRLSTDLQSILDNAKNGVVYFSLGTNVRLDHVSSRFKEEVSKALRKLPFTVLCKWQGLENTTNLHVRKWLPQQAILAHPNVRVFVTQGGLQSSEEAISNAVPLVVIPFFGDQPANAKILEKHGMARTLLPKNVTADYLVELIKEVATEPKYRENALRLRDIFLDQPQSGLDKIVWWCEYLIRHKGAKHLRSPSADISLVEYFMLDIFAFILFTISLPLVIIFNCYKCFKSNKTSLKMKTSTLQKSKDRKKNEWKTFSTKNNKRKTKKPYKC